MILKTTLLPAVQQMVDSRMICDIRELSSRLVAKAENLLGEYNINKQ